MGANVGEIDLGLDLNQKAFNKQLSGIANGATASVMSAFKPLGKLIGATLGVGAVVAFTKSCLELGSNLTEVQNVVDVTFGEMAGQVNAFADSAMTTFGMSETVAKKYMGTLGAMTKSMGVTGQAMYDMSESVTKLTGDVASFYNLSTDEAFDKLKSIWTGETETLKSLGVMLTQTNLDQYALNNGFGKTTAKMTEQEKLMLRYQYTMSALGDATGDFARTQDSWANQTRILSLRFDALKATLGQGFINLFTPIIQMINALLAKLQTLAATFEAFTSKLFGNRGKADSGGGLSKVATDAQAATSSIGGVTDAAKEAAKATGALSIDELNTIGDTSGGGSGGGAAVGDITGSTLDTGIADQAEVTTGKLTSILDDLKAKWQDFTGMLDMKFGDNVWNAIELIKEPLLKLKDTFGQVFLDCQSLGAPLLDWFNGDFTTRIQTGIDSAGIIISGLLDSFNMVFSDIWNVVIFPVLDNFIRVGLPLITQFDTEVVKTLTTLFVSVKEIFDLLWSTGVKPALELITKIWIDLMNTIKQFWDSYGQPIFDGFREAITNAGLVIQNIWNTILLPLWQQLMAILDEVWINHLQPLIAEFLSFVGELAVGALSIYNQFILPVINAFVTLFGPSISNVLKTIMSVLGTVLGTIMDIVKGVIKVFKGLIEFITGIFTGDWDKAWQGISDIIDGIFTAMGDTIKGAINIIIDVINGMTNAITMGINTVIRALNSLHFDAPAWVTELTGITGFGFNLSEIAPPIIPHLAQGGYVGANQPQLAMIGDNPHEGEIVSPESKLMEMAKMAADMSNQNNLSTEYLKILIELLEKLIQIVLDKDFDVQLDGKTLLKQLKDAKTRLGYSFD